METVPDPPSIADLLARAPSEKRVVGAGTLLWRVFFTEGPYPVKWKEFRKFGPTGSRFDHHPIDPPPRVHSDHAILYAADRYSAALAEFFQLGRTVNRTLNKPWLVHFALTEELTLLDLTGAWPLKAGAGAAIASGERSQSRKWSRAIYAAFPEIDGVYYRSSLNPAWLAFALYERAERALSSDPLVHAPLTDSRLAPLLSHAVAESGYDLV